MPIRCVAGFEKKFGSSGRAIPAHPEPCALVEASRHAISKPIRQEKVRVPFFRPRELEIAMEDALHEINEILERKDINDKHKAMILGEDAKRFYNLWCEILAVALKMRAE